MSESPPGQPTILYLDPGFVSYGHYRRMAALLRRETYRKGVPLRHVVSKGVDEELVREHELEPLFAERAALHLLRNPVSAIRDFADRLESLCDEIRQDRRNALVFMYAAHYAHLPVIAEVVARSRAKGGDLRACVCLFYLAQLSRGSFAETQAFRRRLTETGRMLRRLDSEPFLDVCTDSSRAQELLADLMGVRVDLLPLPIDDPPASSGRGEARYPVHLGYPGKANRRSGYDLMYEAYKRVVSGPIAEKVIFHIRHDSGVTGELRIKGFERAKQSIRHYRGYLSQSRYEDFLARCDVILLPYLRSYYPVQTSGVAVEALARGKLLVVPADTWMADEVGRLRAGRIFESGDPGSFAQAICSVVRDLPDIRRQSQSKIDRFRQGHSPSALLDELLRRAGTACPAASEEPSQSAWEQESVLEEVTQSVRSDARRAGLLRFRPWMSNASGHPNGRRAVWESVAVSAYRALAGAKRRLGASTRAMLGQKFLERVHELRRDLERPLRGWLIGAEGITPLAWLASAHARRARRRLGSLRGLYRGRRCFIMGNGPSLNEMDLSLLKREHVWGSNRAHLLYDRLSWRHDFYVGVDDRVIPDIADELQTLSERMPGTRFFFPLGFLLQGLFEPAANIYWLGQLPMCPRRRPAGMFSTDPSSWVSTVKTVTITAMQLAVYLGFDPIYLIGCDTSYRVPDTVRREDPQGFALTSTADDDPNHFAPEYFGRGRAWHDPRPQEMTRHYRQAKKVCDRLGVRVYNATVGGDLEVFPRVWFEDLFKARRARRPIAGGGS